MPKSSSKPRHHVLRLTYLEQAAFYLSTSASQHSTLPTTQQTGPARSLLTHLRSISKKTQIRLDTSTKARICKLCNSPLIPDHTSETRMDNASKGGRKRCADVEVVECLFCKGVKRKPVGAKRQLKRAGRTKKDGKNNTGNNIEESLTRETIVGVE